MSERAMRHMREIKTKSQSNAQRNNEARHHSIVIGVAVDSLNKVAVSCCQQGKIITWSFTTHAPHKRGPRGTSATKIPTKDKEAPKGLPDWPGLILLSE